MNADTVGVLVVEMFLTLFFSLRVYMISNSSSFITIISDVHLYVVLSLEN